jgi:hypothetical protein
MPIRSFLGRSAFTPDEFGELARVFEEIVAALSLKTHVDREAAAKTILRVAFKQQFFDPAKIHDQAMAELRDRSPSIGRRRRSATETLAGGGLTVSKQLPSSLRR